MTRILHDARDTVFPDSADSPDPVGTSPAESMPAGSLWLDAAQIASATGWDWKPQGLCRDDTCMPVPRDPGRGMIDADRLDVAAFWRYAGWPVVHDQDARIWVLGEGAAGRADALSSLQAPDFELPDLQGRMHRLSDLRGQRVFLATWASW